MHGPQRLALSCPDTPADHSPGACEMLEFYHHPFCAASRFVRLALEEYALGYTAHVELFWNRRPGFLELNAAGETPVLLSSQAVAVCGAGAIMEFLEDTHMASGARLMPQNPYARAETRRLVHWALDKFNQEVVRIVVHERILKGKIPVDKGGGAPDSRRLGAARKNFVHHLRYFGYLADTRRCMAGEALSFADLAVAACLSCLDYLGEMRWPRENNLKIWYARLKSRPAFRPLLNEHDDMVAPCRHYADLDF